MLNAPIYDREDQPMACSNCENDKQHEIEKEHILTKIYNLLSGLKTTLVGGVFLAASLTLRLLGVQIPAINTWVLDPAWVAVILCGYPLLYSAIHRLLFSRGLYKISASLLISIAMVAAIYINELFAAGQVAFIMAIGGILEDRTVERAKKGIGRLISLVPEQGRVIKDGKEFMVDVAQIRKDNILRVLPGEAVPVDGEIISGNTSIDQSIVTGESLPVDKSAGDTVFCGTINCFGSIDIKVTKTGKDSSLQKLIRLVQEADANKAPTQLIVDKWAIWLVPTALLLAVATYFVTGDIQRAVTVAIVFCPCALALATPTSIMAAIGQAAKHGVIIKSGEALENMGKVDTIVFDKTGTLTYGELAVSDVVVFDAGATQNGNTTQDADTTQENGTTQNAGMTETELLSLVASVESRSEHPLGKATVAHAKSLGVKMLTIENFTMLPGKGISADVSGKRVLCGNIVYLNENGVVLDNNAAASLEQFRLQGKAVILISQAGKCIGIIALSDILRDTAAGMVRELKEMRANAALLTGDNRQTAEYFASQAGIDQVYAELLPAQKVEQVQALQAAGRNVCMIGDGVNDAPALKTANVGVAMGAMGSDIAVDAADIALMGDDIGKIPYLKRLSNATVKLILINITISIVFNIIAIILSMLGVLDPVTGALAHNAGSIAVILNATLLYDRKYI